MLHKILAERYPEKLVRIPDDGYDFITKAFALDPRERLSAAEALEHPFLLPAKVKNEAKVKTEAVKVKTEGVKVKPRGGREVRAEN